MQLLALSGAHFTVDLFAGMIPAILPAIRDEFGWGLPRGASVLVVLYLTCNGVQVLAGHLRPRERRPFLLHLGLILSAGICLLGLLPTGQGALAGMLLLGIVSGAGIAVVHPEGLRGVHRLKHISPSVSTAVFMAGGFLGFASGGGIAARLVLSYGFKGLYPLAACSLFGMLAIILLKIRLAVEPRVPGKAAPGIAETSGLQFWAIFAMAMPAAVSTTLVTFLIPTVLDDLKFELTLGGYATTLFGMGGAVGSFVWAYIARRRGELVCTIAALLLTLPFLLAFLLLIESSAAIWLLIGAGFCAMSAYTLMITLSRHATGPMIGLRMGAMVGGTWALAYIAYWGLTFAADRCGFSTRSILNLTPWGYLLSGGFGVFVLLKVGAAPCGRPQSAGD
jgi:FSR family fosmidomycin resistance protein-like MFS transporter